MSWRPAVGDRVETVAGRPVGDGTGGELGEVVFVNRRAGKGQPQRWNLRVRWDSGRENWVWPSDVRKVR